MRKDLLAGAAVGAAAIGGAMIYFLRERATPGPDYRVLLSDGSLEIRHYPEIVVAEAVVEGPRQTALEQGFRRLADYIFAKSRTGEQLPMTVPVLQDGGNPMASDPPLFDDAIEGSWRIRFVMPEGRTTADLPEPPAGTELVTVEPRRIGAISFSGRPTDERLSAHEDQLRGWLARHSEQAAAEPEYAFYNSPMIPPPLRRNEVLIPLG